MMTKASFDHPGEGRDPRLLANLIVPAKAGIPGTDGSGRLHETPAFAGQTPI